jgi:hypothetical protein
MEGVRGTLTEPLDRKTAEMTGWREYGNSFNNIVLPYEIIVDDKGWRIVLSMYENQRNSSEESKQ